MKEFRLLKWYPSLPTEWHTEVEKAFPIIVVEREDGYHLHPSLKGMTRFAIISEREVERNEEFWEEKLPDNNLIEFCIEQYNYSCKQKKNETLKEFAIRAQKELDKLNIPITIKV